MINEIKKTTEELRREVIERSLGYITAGFGLVAGLAWNEAIKSTIETIFPSDQGGLIAKWVYAIIFTTLLVVVTIQLNRFISKILK